VRKPKRKRMLDLTPEQQEVRRKKWRSWSQACYSKYRQRKAEELARPMARSSKRRVGLRPHKGKRGRQG